MKNNKSDDWYAPPLPSGNWYTIKFPHSMRKYPIKHSEIMSRFPKASIIDAIDAVKYLEYTGRRIASGPLRGVWLQEMKDYEYKKYKIIPHSDEIDETE